MERGKYLYPCTAVVFVMSVYVLITVPIKWTPLIAIYPKYNTWHQVSYVHLLQVLARRPPADVAPLTQCTSIQQTSVSRTDVLESKIKDFPYDAAEKIMATLQKTDDLTVFLPILNLETKATLLYVYLVLVEALDKARIGHVLLHGSLLGLHRFSTITPWDDDLDVAIKVNRWREVRDALSCIEGFELLVDPSMRWSFFQSNSTRSESMQNKKYPFIDIFLQEEDDTHVWGINKINRRQSLFSKHLVYPIKWAYLDGIRVPIPRSPLEVLEIQYRDLDMCLSQQYGHFTLPKKRDVVMVSCSELYPVYGQFPIPSQQKPFLPQE